MHNFILFLNRYKCIFTYMLLVLLTADDTTFSISSSESESEGDGAFCTVLGAATLPSNA